jgi:hypothetical protein
MTAGGADGCGVGTRWRGEISSPVSRSTTAALIPLPPTSTPIASRRAPGSIGAPVKGTALSWSSSVVASAAMNAACAATASASASALASAAGSPSVP